MKHLDITEIRALLEPLGVWGDDSAFKNLNRLCYHDETRLKTLGKVLVNICDGDASRVDDPNLRELFIEQLASSDCPFLVHMFYGDTLIGITETVSYQTMGRHFGEYGRGERLTSIILAGVDNAFVEHDRALYLIELGQLNQAEIILRGEKLHKAKGLYRGIIGESLYQFPAKINLVDILVLRGNLREAYAIADTLVSLYDSQESIRNNAQQTISDALWNRAALGEFVKGYRITTGFNPYDRRAVVRTFQGDIQGALSDFKRAEAFQRYKLEKLHQMKGLNLALRHRKTVRRTVPPTELREIERIADEKKLTYPLTGHSAVYYAILLTRLGKLKSAQHILDYTRRWAAHPDYRYPLTEAVASLALSDVHRLMGDFDSAKEYISGPLAWSKQSGQKEVACWSHLSLARLYLHQGQYDAAEVEISHALDIAVEHGFRLYEIDSRITHSRLHLLRGDLESAEQSANRALMFARDPACDYKWAQGNAYHLLAEILLHPDHPLNDPSAQHTTARTNLYEAIDIRLPIRDPRLQNSERLLATIQN